MVRSRTIDAAARAVLDRRVHAHTVADSSRGQSCDRRVATSSRPRWSSSRPPSASGCSRRRVAAPERDLAEQLGVSRNTLREAIAEAARLGHGLHPSRPRRRVGRHVCRAGAGCGAHRALGGSVGGRDGLPSHRRAGAASPAASRPSQPTSAPGCCRHWPRWSTRPTRQPTGSRTPASTSPLRPWRGRPCSSRPLLAHRPPRRTARGHSRVAAQHRPLERPARRRRPRHPGRRPRGSPSSHGRTLAMPLPRSCGLIG